MSEYNLGTASGKIEIDGRAASVGFKVAETAAGAFFDVVKMRVADVQQLGRRMAAVGAGGVAGFGLAIKTASAFQKEMSGVQAVTGATGKDFDALKQKAMDLGRDTVFSASEAANAIEELAKAGVPVADILNGAADAAVALAAAGGIGIAEAATISANAMNQFSIKAKDMAKVTDVLAGVANTSASDVSGIGQSLSQVGAVANLAGLKFRDTAIAIGEMADAGIQGSDAGTSLKTMLNNLIPVTDRQNSKFKELHLLTYNLAKANKTLAHEGLPLQKSMGGVFKALGKYNEELGKGKVGSAKNLKAIDQMLLKYGGLHNAFFKANGDIKDLRGLQDTLGKSLKGMTKEQKLSTLETLFGADAMRASAILSLDGAKGYDKFSKAVSKTKASDVAAARLDNLSGAVEQFKGSMETAMIIIGNVFLPVVTKIVQGATWLVNLFTKLPKPIQVAIAVIGGLVSVMLLISGLILAFLPVIAAFIVHMLLMRTIGVVASSFRVLWTSIKAGEGVMAASTAASARMSTGMTTLGKRSLFTGRIFLLVGKMMRAAWLMATGPIGLAIVAIAAIVAIGVLLYKKWKPFHDLVDKIASVVRDKFIAAWHALQPALVAAWNTIKKLGSWIASVLMPVLQKIAAMLIGKLVKGWHEISDAIGKQLMPAISQLVGAFRNIQPQLSATGGFISSLVGHFMSFANAVGKFLLPILKKIGELLVTFVIPVLLKVAGFLTGVIIDAIVLFVKGAIQAITGIIQIFTGLINFFKGLFTGNWSQMWEGVKQIFTGIWNLIIGLIKVYLAIGVLKAVGLAFKGLLLIVRGGWQLILGLFRGAGRGIWAIVKGAFSLILSIIRNYIRMWGAIFRGGWRFITNIVKGAQAVLRAIIRGVMNFIVAIIKGQLRLAQSIFKGAWNTVKSLTKGAFSGIKTAVSNGIKNVISLVKSLPGKIKSGLGNLGSLLLDAGRKLIQGLIDGIGEKIGAAINKVKDGVNKIKGLLPGSPVKWGPLKSWNRGGAGKRLMETLQDGISKEQKRTVLAAGKAASAMSGAFNSNLALQDPIVMATVGQRPAATPMTPPASAGRRPVRAKKPQNGKLRLVEGRLYLDKSGKAYIRGVAEEVVDENEYHNARRGRKP